MNKTPIIDFNDIAGYTEFLASLSGKSKRIPLGLPRSARLPFLANLQRDLNIPILFITSRSDRLVDMHEEFNFWTDNDEHLIFAEPSALFYERANWTLETRKERLEVLTSLSKNFLPTYHEVQTKPIIFSSAKSIMTRTIPRRIFIKNLETLRLGEQKSIEQLIKRWVMKGYEPTEIVVVPGQLSRRGGLVDIWSMVEEYPVRIEFFGDELETMRSFDPTTQRSMNIMDRIFITPAREYIQDGDSEDNGSYQTKFPDFLIPQIYSSSATILDYLTKDAIILIDNAASVSITAEEIETQSMKMRIENISSGIIDENFPLPYVTWSEIEDVLEQFCVIDLGYPETIKENALSAAISPSPRFGGSTNDFFDFLDDKQCENSSFFIVSKQSERLTELHEMRTNSLWENENVHLISGSLSGGFHSIHRNGSHTYLFSDNEIFGWERPISRQHRTKQYEAPEFSYGDLEPGDLVVHIDYGIGRFAGLVRRSLEGVEKDYLRIIYADDDQLFVPVHQVDRLSLYIGADERIPRLSSFGSAEWSSNKQRVRNAVRDVAHDLLELYARRQTADGYLYKKDTEWQKILESSFPYTETSDQEQAVLEVKQDMEGPRPMDRLLCGDVGYGKTEVALRSAFKAVMDGKQVAMLVPTTVLAQQHFNTFSERLVPFPVKVEMLSRFRTSYEQTKILRGLKTGEIDIVIGTHRLIQPDVVFKDLGLLIIDEEQRFGVTHKERFKKLRSEIDVLTLTATPIPRTLYMALAGIRDISVINSPPSDRLPIQTYIGGYDQEVVRRAIIREIDRGGQVFFVHNRVQTISAMAAHLKKIVPEARLEIAHGQMNEKLLADVMRRFTAGEIDVLLSTSIIESGLDIPNANTLILDRGDTFGLAQLYQLRGRVGRGSSRAFAYLFHHKKKTPTPEGLERLETIAEHTHLGVGYSIAMRDLEMRGAGDLLGTEQHGYIASVGLNLYTRLLAQAVADITRSDSLLRKSSMEPTITAREIRPLIPVDLPLNAGIPVDYIPDERLRLQIYRRIADVNTLEEINELEKEFKDRFGDFGEELKNLLWQVQIKLLAEESGLAAVTVEGDHIVLRFPPLPENVKERDILDMNDLARRGKNAYWLAVDAEGVWKTHLNEMLMRLKNHVKNEEVKQ